MRTLGGRLRIQRLEERDGPLAPHGRWQRTTTPRTLTTMTSVLCIPHGWPPPVSVRFGSPEWPFFADAHSDLQCRDLAESPDWSDPLILTGASGLGKSLLARSLLRQHRSSSLPEASAEAPVRVSTGNDFKRSLHQALDTQTLPQWRSEWAQQEWVVIDALDQLLDDALAQRTLETLLDDWLDAGTKVILTMSVMPARLVGMTRRLASRCSVGQQVALQTPGPAARAWLVRFFLRERALPDQGDHAQVLLEQWASSLEPVPVVRGWVTELAARSSEWSPSILAATLAEIIQGGAVSEPTIDQIARLVARWYAVPLREMRGASRRRATVRARSAAMWMARKWTGASYQRIGEYFQRRDHSTVLHACRRFDRELKSSPCRDAVEAWERELRNAGMRCHPRGKAVASLSEPGDDSTITPGLPAPHVETPT